MTLVVPFSQAVRERTRSGHSESEGATFMSDLIAGLGTKEDYIALVVQHFFIYRALERAADQMKNDPVAAAFVTPELTRLPSLEADLAFLLGHDWSARIVPCAATERYVDRLNEVAATWNGGFIAHHYTRYLGDLSGGQMIAAAMRRQFGFDHQGLEFYRFEDISDPASYKDTYRAKLDAVLWNEQERENVIDEVLLAYRLNTEVFIDLATR